MNINILVAEDDEDICNLLRLYLEGEGYHIIEAENGIAALQKNKEYTLDIAILDIMMPKMDGYELIKSLRKHSDIPILVISAKKQDDGKILGLNLGADNYIAKPFNPVGVVARIKAQIRRANLRSGDVLRVRNLCCCAGNNQQNDNVDFRAYMGNWHNEITWFSCA